MRTYVIECSTCGRRLEMAEPPPPEVLDLVDHHRRAHEDEERDRKGAA